LSSILNALKKLEDNREQAGQEPSLSGSLDTKQVVRKGIQKKHTYGRILWACFGITAVTALLWFAFARNPANAPDQRALQPENRTAEARSANPASSKTAAENRFPAHAQHKAQRPEASGSAPVPAPPAPASMQKNMAKFQDMAAKQGKKEEKNDPFRVPDELREALSSVPEKSGGKAAAETAKPVPSVSALPSAGPSDVKAVEETAKPAPRTDSPAALLPAPKHPVKTEPVQMLPPAKNPMKIQLPQPLPVPAEKTMQDAQPVAGQTESVKMPDAASEPVKKAPNPESVKPESVKMVPVPETAKSPARPEPVKPAPLAPGDCSSVSEKTAGETGLAIQALVWSEDPAGRMAVINGNIVREKGMVNDVSLVRIGSDCIVFQKGNEQWMQKFRLN